VKKKYWKHKTNTGKVVYPRKKKEMRILDVVRMCERMSRKPHVWFDDQLFAINTLSEIVRTAFYPYWLRAIHIRASNPGAVEHAWNRIEQELRHQWSQQTTIIIRQLGERFYIPEWIMDFVLDNFYEHIWNTIWTLTDPLFGGR